MGLFLSIINTRQNAALIKRFLIYWGADCKQTKTVFIIGTKRCLL